MSTDPTGPEPSRSPAWLGVIAELKRRSVYRFATLYAVVCWAVMQVSSLVLDAFDAPRWVLQLLLIFILLGLPLALVLAWAFDLLPNALAPAADVGAPQRPARLAKLLLGLTLGVGLALAGWFMTRKVVGHEDTVVAGSAAPAAGFGMARPEKSIAVLPLSHIGEAVCRTARPPSAARSTRSSACRS